jgi:GMP synthase C terminal domain
VVSLRSMALTGGITADFYQLEMKFLGETATRVINGSRASIAWSKTSRPPATVEWGITEGVMHHILSPSRALMAGYAFANPPYELRRSAGR